MWRYRNSYKYNNDFRINIWYQISQLSSIFPFSVPSTIRLRLQHGNNYCTASLGLCRDKSRMRRRLIIDNVALVYIYIIYMYWWYLFIHYLLILICFIFTTQVAFTWVELLVTSIFHRISHNSYFFAVSLSLMISTHEVLRSLIFRYPQTPLIRSTFT